MKNKNLSIGIIEWYDQNKRFGIIKNLKDQDIFFHHSNWWDSSLPIFNTEFNSISDKKVLVFEIEFERNKYSAKKCKYFDINNLDHWECLFSRENKKDYSVTLKNIKINILELIISDIHKEFNFGIIQEYFKDIFDDAFEMICKGEKISHKLFINTDNKNFENFFLRNLTSKINKLDNATQYEFWHFQLLPGYLPNKIVILEYYKSIDDEKLKQIHENEIIHLILNRQIKDLSNNFKLIDFVNLFKKLKHVKKPEKLKNLKNKLSEIKTKYFYDYFKNRVLEILKDFQIDYFVQYIDDLKEGLPQDIKSYINTILSEIIYDFSDSKIMISCCKSNLIELREEKIISILSGLDEDYLIEALEINESSYDYKRQILDHLLNFKCYSIILNKSKEIDDSVYNEFETLIYNQASAEEYINLWIDRKVQKQPNKFLEEYLNHQEERYQNLLNSIQRNMLSKDIFIETLYSNLEFGIQIDDRYKFYKIFYSIKYLIELEPNSYEKILNLNNDFFRLILWHLKKIKDFDFKLLKNRFIYFNPDDQVFILKRLFFLKFNREIDFDINSLDEILRADLDLYLTNKKFNDDFVLDISTHFIIESIKSFVETGNFAFKSKLIYKDLRNNKKKKFQISKYFDKCEGRQTAGMLTHEEERKIKRVNITSKGKRYDFYKVTFKYNKNIVEDLQNLPKKRYYKSYNYWGVPLKYKKELFEIAQKHDFFIDLPDKLHYTNNQHLISYSRNKKNIPKGIIFCEGRKSNKKHKIYNTEFWKCAGHDCFQNCITNHIDKENTINENKDAWEDYTLLDFLKILDINVDEDNGFDIIKDGHYVKLLGHVNAFNRLVDRLYCDECKEIIYPKNISHFAFYTDVRFYCINNKCSKKDKPIYLNRCFASECNSIIDSRISKKCSHGIYICENCGSCCSQKFFKNRLEMLKKYGGYINQELLHNIKNKNGHLNKKEYYCYNCAGMMTEVSMQKFECFICGTSYDFNDYKWIRNEWSNKENRRKDYPVIDFDDNFSI